MNDKKKVLYRTSDIYFSAYLQSMGIDLIGTESEESYGKNKVKFVFNVPEGDIQRLKTSFFAGTGTVKAMHFVNNLKALKSMCFT